MNTLDILEALLNDDTDATGSFRLLVKVARAAQAIDLREQDISIGPTRSAIQDLHAALQPLLHEIEA